MNVPTVGTVSLAVVCFGDSLKNGAISLDSFMRAAVAHGLGAVELCDLSMRDPVTAADLAARHGLRMPSVALRNDFTGSPELLTQHIEHLRSWMPIVRGVGGSVARVWTGWQSTNDNARKQIIDGFDAVVPAAIEAGVTVAVETHGGLSNDPDFVAELCSRFPTGAVGACIDFGNLPAPNRRALIAAFVPMAVHVHVKTYEFHDGVETTVPLDWAIEQLCQSGYDRQWVIEYEGKPPYDDGIAHTIRALARANVVADSSHDRIEEHQ